MRKLTILLIILTLSICITGCGGDFQPYTENIPTVTTQPAPISDNPLIAAEFVDDLVLNGSGTDALGFCGLIRISKATLRGITIDEYVEFCEEYVGNIKYLWVSIICDDGTGIQFTGSQYTIATYGTIDYEGKIIEDLGYIRQTATGFNYEQCE